MADGVRRRKIIGDKSPFNQWVLCGDSTEDLTDRLKLLEAYKSRVIIVFWWIYQGDAF